MIKQLLIFGTLFIYYSSILSMTPSPAAHIKQQIELLKAEGASQADIAHIATNSLQSLLDHSLIRFPLDLYMIQYKTLVEAGGDKNVRHPKSGKTALMFAAIDGRPDIFEALLALGVDPTVTDSYGCNAVQQSPVIKESTIPEIKRLFEEAEIAFYTQKLKYA